MLIISSQKFYTCTSKWLDYHYFYSVNWPYAKRGIAPYISTYQFVSSAQCAGAGSNNRPLLGHNGERRVCHCILYIMVSSVVLDTIFFVCGTQLAKCLGISDILCVHETKNE